MTLVALDIDGTVLTETGELLDAVKDEVHRVVAAGHEVMLATGRSVAMTLPVIDRLGITPHYVVCANGAITLKRDAEAPAGYRREWVETFDPRETLLAIRPYLEGATYLVEDEESVQHYLGELPEGVLIDGGSVPVTFEQMLDLVATRVVVVSPEHGLEEFLGLVEQIGLDSVSYNVGWAAWLDIAPQDVTKATALERVREALGVDRADVIAVGDGRNDIEMLEWAGEFGRGIAMEQAPDEVRAIATEVAPSVEAAGVATILRSL